MRSVCAEGQAGVFVNAITQRIAAQDASVKPEGAFE
jgi:hypothetical protein